MRRLCTAVSAGVLRMLKPTWERTIFSSTDLEERYCQRLAASTVTFHMFLVAMFFISMLGACAAYFASQMYSEANLAASAAMWSIHSVWLIILRFAVLPNRVLVKVVPPIVLILDVLILGTSNPETQNHWGTWKIALDCAPEEYFPDRCYRKDYWMNVVITSGIISMFGIYLIPYRQSLFMVPTAWTLYINMMKVGLSGTTIRFFNVNSPWFLSSASLLISFSAIILVLRYANESCDRELFRAHRAQVSASKAQEDLIRASRRLCRSVFDMVFTLKQDSFDFCHTSDRGRFLKALRIDNQMALDRNTFLDFFLNVDEHERFRGYVQVCTPSEESTESPAQLISVPLKDGLGVTISTKVYCTRFQKFNFERPFDVPEEFLLVGVIWEGTSPATSPMSSSSSTLQQPERSTPDQRTPSHVANTESLSVSHLRERTRSKQSSRKKPLPSCSKTGPLQRSTSHDSGHSALTSIPEDLRYNCESARSENACSAQPATQGTTITADIIGSIGDSGSYSSSSDASESPDAVSEVSNGRSHKLRRTSQEMCQQTIEMAMRQWHLQPHSTCCHFHRAVAAAQTAVEALGGEPCSDEWKPNRAWQCSVCSCLNTNRNLECQSCGLGKSPKTASQADKVAKGKQILDNSRRVKSQSTSRQTSHCNRNELSNDPSVAGPPQVSAFTLTSTWAKRFMICDALQRWNCHRGGSDDCCPFHVAVRDALRLVFKLLRNDCNPLWVPLAGGQCMSCGVMYVEDDSDEFEDCDFCGGCVSSSRPSSSGDVSAQSYDNLSRQGQGARQNGAGHQCLDACKSTSLTIPL